MPASLRAGVLRAETSAHEEQAMNRIRFQGDCATATLDRPRADAPISQRGGRPGPDCLGPRADSPDEFAPARDCSA